MRSTTSGFAVQPGHVHAPRAELNEERHVKTSAPERVHGEEKASIDAVAVEVPAPKVPGSPFYF